MVNPYYTINADYVSGLGGCYGSLPPSFPEACRSVLDVQRENIVDNGDNVKMYLSGDNIMSGFSL
jgi:hypothetical protein